ncbi:MAG: bifunctional phosphopantothenoylcysteine decarboxylase/phosphopantothenate--cysteine ligase CoaBC [Acidobacteria bacterium]|nr:bifunctional phosphopantothenoylcysteine decarboxylase/phosphopantothenate--cysteine ligase CoaBC [Acidobacteriota bacterium]
MSAPYRITLGVTGCIGAYKAVLVLRELQKAGVEVTVVMTRSAVEFIQPLTFQALSGKPVITDMWKRDQDSEIKHIALAQNTDLLLVSPLTANTMAKFAQGIADDFLSTLYLSVTSPVLLAPAMNVEMWRHPATQENLERLRQRGVAIIEPEAGYLACGMVGEGRLADPTVIAQQALELVQVRTDLSNEVVLITAGPTIEDLDPVRFLTNRSSGKMGYALAEAARSRGATVILISGPTRLVPPSGVTFVSVRTTREMYQAVLDHLPGSTIVLKAAAVCDFRPKTPELNKIKKRTVFSLELEATEDILAEIGRRRTPTQVIVGFAAETEHLEAHAASKLQRKNVDLIALNDVSRTDIGFDVSNNQVTLLGRDTSRRQLPLLSKRETADRILDAVLDWKQSRTLATTPISGK